MAGYLADQFCAGGFPATAVHILPLKTAGGEETASLVVRYRGSGALGLEPTLSAHMDVVDALPADPAPHRWRWRPDRRAG